MKADRAAEHVARCRPPEGLLWPSNACCEHCVGAWRTRCDLVLSCVRRHSSYALPNQGSRWHQNLLPRGRSGNGPVLLLLHGFPTSSHMFRNLMPILADRYRVIAPDYPGYGQSDMPDRTKFAYTFDHFAELVDGLLDQLGVGRYAMYVMDYGAPVGWRLALKHPERMTGLIVQNGNAYEEGLKEFWTRSRPIGPIIRRRTARRCMSWLLPKRRYSIHRWRRRCQPHLTGQLGA